ncbi:MAG: T9SS type A sorting domain-containing protein [Ignavibacteriae bacterium]|nr:T9SS type A sorting domain-containing protein [Ignavibacteriota bacterium]
MLTGNYFTSVDTGYVVGYYGVIYKTTDGGGTLVGINHGNNQIPEKFSLSQNYPNPFNPVTKINFDIAKTGFASLIVFDVLGRKVETLVNQKMSAGSYNVSWDASQYPSGVYFYRITAEGFSDTKKLLLLK